MHPKAPDGCWKTISANIIGPLPLSCSFDTILAIVDMFSKMMHVVPTNTTITANERAQLYHLHVWRYYGIPEIFISDYGPQFTSRFMEALLALGTSINLSTTYYPQTDGQTECLNQDVEQHL